MFTSLKTANGGHFVRRVPGAHPVRRLFSWELIAVDSGVLRMFEEEKEFLLRAGDFLLLRPGRKHGGIGEYEEKLSFYWVHFELDEENALPGSGTFQNPEKVYDMFRLFLLDQSEKSSPPENKDLLLQLLLNECCRLPEKESRTVPPLVRNAVRIIRLRACDALFGTAEIAKELNCGPDHLNRLFKKENNCTLTEYINAQRINHARELLCSSNASVKEIMSLCGITDSTWFFRLFRRHCGMTPAEYRRFHSSGHINFK